jgi:hypothetical protein
MKKRWTKTERPGDYAYPKHPVLLLPSGPDKIWALKSHNSEPAFSIALLFVLDK